LRERSIQEEIAEKVKPEESWMKVQGPIPHWNNFTVPELKRILEHCVALERLGIAQDEEMMVSIERDIALREKISGRHVHYELKPTKLKQQIVQNRSKTNKIIRKATQNIKQQPQDYLLEQNV
jgi:hypothetical protein